MARRNAPPDERERLAAAIDLLLDSSKKVFDTELAAGPAQAAATQRLARQLLTPQGHERIKEAAALLVARDVPAAVETL